MNGNISLVVYTYSGYMLCLSKTMRVDEYVVKSKRGIGVFPRKFVVNFHGANLHENCN